MHEAVLCQAAGILIHARSALLRGCVLCMHNVCQEEAPHAWVPSLAAVLGRAADGCHV